MNCIFERCVSYSMATPNRGSDLVIRRLLPNIWTFSKPFYRYNIIPFGGRTTAIKLSDGRIFLLASTKLDQETKDVIKNDMGGNVGWIAAFDKVHTMFTSEYAAEWPEAKLIGVAPLEELRKDIKWDALFGRDPDPLAGIGDEIKAEYFRGHRSKDVAFLHVPTRTLIEADILFNLPAYEQFSKTSNSPHPVFGKSFWASMSPEGRLHKVLAWYGVSANRQEMINSAKVVSGWDFDRIIPCHGDVIEKEGKKAFEETYKWFLEAWDKQQEEARKST